MTKANRFLTILLQSVITGFLLSCTILSSKAIAIEPLGNDVDASLPEVSLNIAARTIRDPDNSLTVEDVLNLPVKREEFRKENIASFGFSGVTYWFIASVSNQEHVPLQRLLVFEPTWLDDIQVTLIDPEGVTQEFKGGDQLTFKHRSIPHRKINFELTLPPGKSRLLIRTQTRDPYVVAMTLWERSAFFESETHESQYSGILYGVLGVMLLYNLFLFVSVREPIYAAYVTYVLSFLIAHSTYNGRLYSLLWPDSPVWGNWAHSVFIYVFMIAGLLFAVNFLELRKKLFKAYRLLMGMMILVFSVSLITAVSGYSLHVASSILLIIAYSVFIIWIGTWSLFSGNRAARYFLIATAAGFIGSSITALAVSGFIPFTTATYRAVDFGMMIDAVLLSLALADRLRIARAETEEAKSELLEATRSYAHDLEKTVEQRTLELSKANATKDKFFSIVAHDLRGPIGGMASLLNNVVLSPEDFNDEALTLMRNTTKNTNNLLEQLLIWARSQKGEIDFRPESFDLCETLIETQELFFAQAQAKDIHLDLNVDGPCLVFADVDMVKVILRNLTNNALKFTGSGGSVSASMKCENSFYLLRITDTGTGMSEKEQQALFHLDTKPQSTPGTQTETGTGLGLILCNEFVEKNGGSIGVRSEKGKGSTFWFTLPKA